LHSVGATYKATWGGNGNYYGGGKAGSDSWYGDQYGNGGAYTYGTQNTTSPGTSLNGGMSGGYFQGGGGGDYGGGGAGLVAIGGNGANAESVNSQGGAGIFAKGGLDGNGTTRRPAAWFDAGNVIVNGGSVGIGTASPTEKLRIKTDADGTVQSVYSFGISSNNPGMGDPSFPTYSTANTAILNSYYRQNGSVYQWARYLDISINGSPDNTNGGGVIRFLTNSITSGSSPVERMRINESGNIGIGITAPGALLHVNGAVAIGTPASGGDIRLYVSGPSATQVPGLFNNTDSGTGSENIVIFQRTNGTVGTITSTNTTTSYNTTSDLRLKTDIVDTHFGLNDLMNINVRDFTFISDKSHTQHTGFIAQQLNTIYPDAVSIPSNINDSWMVDYSKLTPLLVKGVQELNLKLTDASSLDTTKATSLGSLVKKFLADMGNNVTDLYASVIHSDKIQTKMLCVGTTCVTEDQFLEIVNKSGITTGTQGGNQSNNLTPEQIEAARVAKIATDLATIKTSAGALTQANYTEATWATFQTALTTALALPEDTDANKTDKTAAITSAIAGLTPIAQAPTLSDLTAYNTAVNAKAEVDYTSESWTAYQVVITANVVTTTNSQTEVDNATSNITAAQANLVP
jgi:hypothetical protein